jgi:hypothetical protein
MPVTKHKYDVGQKVRYFSRMRVAAPNNEFEVVRLLPAEGGEFQYRIKSALEKTERVVTEDQLSNFTAREAAG